MNGKFKHELGDVEKQKHIDLIELVRLDKQELKDEEAIKVPKTKDDIFDLKLLKEMESKLESILKLDIEEIWANEQTNINFLTELNPKVEQECDLS